MLVDYSMTKYHNNNINNIRYNGHPVIPLKIKNHNIALPVLTDRIKDNNLKNYEKIFLSNIFNHKKLKSKSIEFFKFYHPWLSNICKNEEINTFMSYCYNITKITPPPVRISKIKINDTRNSDDSLNKNEKNYRMINRMTRKRLNSVGINTKGMENYEQNGLLSIENNEQGKINFFNPIKERVVNKRLRDSFLASSKKEIGKNSTNANSDYHYHYIVDTSKIKNNRLNNSISHNYDKSNNEILKYHLNNNYSTITGGYKTIKIKKIKKIKKNDKYIDRKISRDTFRIGAKFIS